MKIAFKINIVDLSQVLSLLTGRTLYYNCYEDNEGGHKGIRIEIYSEAENFVVKLFYDIARAGISITNIQKI